MTIQNLTAKEIIFNMQSKCINEIQFKTPELQSWCEQLLNDGCVIFTSDKSDKKTYFHYMKHGKIGYCQVGRFYNIEISSEYVPTKNFGTGSIYIENPTELNQFYKAFHHVNVCSITRNSPRPKRYDGLESYFNVSTNRILDKYFITL